MPPARRLENQMSSPILTVDQCSKPHEFQVFLKLLTPIVWRKEKAAIKVIWYHVPVTQKTRRKTAWLCTPGTY